MRKLLSTFRVLPIGKLVASNVDAPWYPSVKPWKRIFVPLLAMVRWSDGRLTRGNVKACAFFAKKCEWLYTKGGTKGLVLYLKTCSVLLMQGLPSSSSKYSSRDIQKGVAVSATGDGLPRIIPRDHRHRIRSGDPRYIRLWMTLFGLYRAFSYKAAPKLSTITSPGKVIPKLVSKNWAKFLPRFVAQLEEHTGEKYLGVDPALALKPEIFPISASGSNTGLGQSSFDSRGHAAWMWVSERWGSTLWQFLWCLGETESTKSIWSLIQDEAKYTPGAGKWSGRISTKQEPAGKVRVFAIVDYWTQVALKPLHTYIMDILKELPTDGTFDQLKPVRRLLKRIPVTQKVYSYDLSAATDRLPVSIQELLLKEMFTEGFAYSWRRLLTERVFKLPRKLGVREAGIRYAVGQPMGAYSSWAMLALTHHAMVQYAAYLAGVTGWFEEYAVLGDDIVIAHDGVAAKYLCICRWFGVTVGIQKSLVASSRTAEFAKKLFVNNKLVSPVPWKLFGVQMASLNGTLTMLQLLKAIDGKTSLANTLFACGVGYKSVTKACSGGWESLTPRLRVLLSILTHPNSGTEFSKSNWLDWLTSQGPNLPQSLHDETLVRLGPFVQAMYDEYIVPLERRLEDVESELYFDKEIESPAERLVSLTVNKKIAAFRDAWTKSSASLRHLQAVIAKLQARQASAVFNQVVRLLENRLAEIPLVPARLRVWKDPTAEQRPRLTQVHSLWKRWRKRLASLQVKESDS